MSEQIAQEIRRQRIFNLFVGVLAVMLVSALVAALSRDLLPAPQEAPVEGTKQPYVASYTLPAEEQWAIEYRQVALTADSSAPGGPRPFSSKWVKNAAYHIIMGEQALRMNQRDAAREHLEFALETLPATTGLRRHLGAVYLGEGAFEKAIEPLRGALEEERAPDVLNNLGVAYIATGNYAPAEALLKEALLQKPDCAGCYKNLALLYRKAGRAEDAAAAFEVYFSLNPRDTQLIESYAESLIAAGQPREALHFLDRLEGADPLPVHLLLARTAAQDNDAKRAVDELRNAAALMTPRQTIEKMHDPVFDRISATQPFEALLYKLEMASVSLSTNLQTAGDKE
jgi:Flp pilus assembly protein TadD